MIGLFYINKDAKEDIHYHGQLSDMLNPWDWKTHICISNLAIISSNNGLSTVRGQAIIWTSAEPELRNRGHFLSSSLC